MYRFQQKNWLQMQQMKEDEEREKKRAVLTPADTLVKDDQLQTLKAQYQQQQPVGLLFPTTYHLQKTVGQKEPSSFNLPADPHQSQMQFNSFEQSQQYNYMDFDQPYIGSRPNGIMIKDEIVEPGLFPNDEPFSETSSIDTELDFAGNHIVAFDPNGQDNHFEAEDLSEAFLNFIPPDENEIQEAKPNFSNAPQEHFMPIQIDANWTNTLQTKQPAKPVIKARRASNGKAQASKMSSSGPNSQHDSSRSTSPNSIEQDTKPFGHETYVDDKKKKRRESHNAVERRRRDNINERITELSILVPDCVESNSPQFKPNKGIVLKKSADYIRHLIEYNKKLQLQIQQQQQQLDVRMANAATATTQMQITSSLKENS